ncbi:MAG: hypothetical protein GEU95_03410 [Rhizobiales bacterium]|nr:hypothetical protein [Hyphomicrobiales bacterium]
MDELRREMRTMCRQFADHLTGTVDKNVRIVFSKDGFIVHPRWRVAGVPSKRGKPEAAKWMATRGLQWDGRAPMLRREMVKALDSGETVPDGNFDLYVEWTVRIQRNDALSKAS